MLKIPTSESGEEILIAPLHMAMLFSAVLNNGVLMEPMLMDRVETASEKQVTRFLPQEITHLLSDQECREFILHIGMDDVGVTSAGFSTTGRFEMVNAYQNPRMDCWYYGYATDGTDSLVLIAVFENIDENNMPEQSVLQPIYEAYFQ